MSLSDITPDLRRRAESHYENIVRALFQQRGFAAPSPGQLGQIVQGAVAGASAAELRAAESASPAIIGRIDQLVTGAMEAGRPRNIHSAEAARLAQLGDQAAAGVLGVMFNHSIAIDNDITQIIFVLTGDIRIFYTTV